MRSILFFYIRFFTNYYLLLYLFFGLGARNVCFQDNQPNCNENFMNVYKNLSKSANNRKDADTYFWMFTRKNPNNPESLHRCGGKLPPDTNFDPQNELIVIINPFMYGICDFALHLVIIFFIAVFLFVLLVVKASILSPNAEDEMKKKILMRMKEQNEQDITKRLREI